MTLMVVLQWSFARRRWDASGLIHWRPKIGGLFLLLFLFRLRRSVEPRVLQRDGRLALDVLTDPEQRPVERRLGGFLVVAVAFIAIEAMPRRRVCVGAYIRPLGAKLNDPLEWNQRIVLGEVKQGRDLPLR